MAESVKAIPCDFDQHEFVEVYYGHKCRICGLFYPHGGAPWDEPSDDGDDDGIE